MRNIFVSTGTSEGFFKRGREIARAIDRGEPLEPEYTLTFEDPADIASITALAQRLHRDRSSVKRDVDILVAAGLLDIEEAPLPGHGRQKYVSAAADRICLQAVVA